MPSDKLDDFSGIEEAPAEPTRHALDILLDEANDDPEARPLTDEDYQALSEEWAALMACKRRVDALNSALKIAEADYTAQRRRMQGAMEAQGTKHFAASDGAGAGTLAGKYWTAVEDADRFHQWVEENHPELLSVNAKRRDSFIMKEYRDKGVATDDPSFPPGIRIHEGNELRVRGPKAIEQENE